MNDKHRELLYRSLDTPLSKAEQKELKRALADSTELQAELAALLRMRESLAESAPKAFGPFFPERVMARIRAEAASPEAVWQSVRSLFRWVAAAAVPVAAALVIWNIQPSVTPTSSGNGSAYQADVIWETPLESVLGDVS
jgi:anti-sigma factor RsiW